MGMTYRQEPARRKENQWTSEKSFIRCKETLSLNDGGIAGNRGIKVLLALRSNNTFIFCSVEILTITPHQPQYENFGWKWKR